jgi:hypothetical protein
VVPAFSGGRWRRWAVLAAILYVFVDVVAPFEHHDLVCHLKTPAHSTACASSPVSTSPRTPSAAALVTLADAGAAVTLLPCIESALLTVATTGRSPPAL